MDATTDIFVIIFVFRSEFCLLSEHNPRKLTIPIYWTEIDYYPYQYPLPTCIEQYNNNNIVARSQINI